MAPGAPADRAHAPQPQRAARRRSRSLPRRRAPWPSALRFACGSGRLSRSWGCADSQRCLRLLRHLLSHIPHMSTTFYLPFLMLKTCIIPCGLNQPSPQLICPHASALRLSECLFHVKCVLACFLAERQMLWVAGCPTCARWRHAALDGCECGPIYFKHYESFLCV